MEKGYLLPCPKCGWKNEVKATNDLNEELYEIYDIPLMILVKEVDQSIHQCLSCKATFQVHAQGFALTELLED